MTATVVDVQGGEQQGWLSSAMDWLRKQAEKNTSSARVQSEDRLTIVRNQREGEQTRKELFLINGQKAAAFITGFFGKITDSIGTFLKEFPAKTLGAGASVRQKWDEIRKTLSASNLGAIKLVNGHRVEAKQNTLQANQQIAEIDIKEQAARQRVYEAELSAAEARAAAERADAEAVAAYVKTSGVRAAGAIKVAGNRVIEAGAAAQAAHSHEQTVGARLAEAAATTHGIVASETLDALQARHTQLLKRREEIVARQNAEDVSDKVLHDLQGERNMLENEIKVIVAQLVTIQAGAAVRDVDSEVPAVASVIPETDGVEVPKEPTVESGQTL